MTFLQQHVYLDSPICIHTIDGQISTSGEHIEQVMMRLQGAQLTVNPVKTFLCKKTVHYFGYTINNGITTTEENIETMKNYPIPKNVL